MSSRRQGSLVQFYFTDEAPAFSMERTDDETANLFHLASLNHDIFAAGGGMMALSTVTDDAMIDEATDRLTAALHDVAAAL
jgi:glutamate-1-semialdehyde aminotransferase